MAETERTYAAIIALLADNTSGDISPEDVRDAIASCMGGYGGLKTDSAQAMTAVIGTSPIKMTTWNDDLPSEGINVISDNANNDIDVTLAGDYEVHFWCSTSSATSGVSYAFQLYVDGVAVDELRTTESASSSDLDSPPAFSGIITLSGGETLDVRVFCSSGSGRSMTVTHGAFWLKRIR